MTTAHRPTFHNAIGGENQGGNFLVVPTSRVCSRDLPSHTKLKHRAPPAVPLYTDAVPTNSFDPTLTNDSSVETKAVLKNKLELKEREHLAKKAKEKAIYEPLEALSDFTSSKLYRNHVPAVLLPDIEENAFPEDEDDQGPEGLNLRGQGGQKDVSESDQDDDDDDEENELLRELEKIKSERKAEEEAKKLAEQAEQYPEERLRILKANPLLIADNGDVLKRRWDDDVVFRNQAKDLPKPKKRFINDTVRSEFHKKFLTRYIQ